MIIHRTNNFDEDRPPEEFGIRWKRDESDPEDAITRLGSATSMVVDTSPTEATYSEHISDFNAYLPWKGMKRTFLNFAGDVMELASEGNYSEHDLGGINDLNDPGVYVRLPYFFYKMDIIDSNTYEYWISPYPLKGYRVHPAFLRWNYIGNSMRITDVYIGAYEANVNADDGYAYSLAGWGVLTNKSRTFLREYPMGWSTTWALGSWSISDWYTWNALLWLYLIEYGGLDSQTPSGSTARGGISKGITNGAQIEKTGWTSSYDVNENGFHSHDLGSLSGQVQCNTNGGNPVYAMSFHGIENLFGNVWKILDGVNINKDDRRFWICTTQAFADQATFGAPYEKTAILAPNVAATYLTIPGDYTDYPEAAWMFGNWGTGGSATTYSCDYYTPPPDWSVHRYPIVGGSYGSGTQGGIWTLDCSMAYTTALATVGARYMQVPLDIDFWSHKNR